MKSSSFTDDFFREYSGQISPLRSFTGSKFVLVMSQLYLP